MYYNKPYLVKCKVLSSDDSGVNDRQNHITTFQPIASSSKRERPISMIAVDENTTKKTNRKMSPSKGRRRDNVSSDSSDSISSDSNDTEETDDSNHPHFTCSLPGTSKSLSQPASSRTVPKPAQAKSIPQSTQAKSASQPFSSRTLSDSTQTRNSNRRSNNTNQHTRQESSSRNSRISIDNFEVLTSDEEDLSVENLIQLSFENSFPKRKFRIGK